MQITSTPCVTICRIDPACGLCIGCGRTSLEIARWVEMSETERLVLMDRLPHRFNETPALQAARVAHDALMATRLRTRRRERSRS